MNQNDPLLFEISIIGLAVGGLLSPGGFNDAKYVTYNKRSDPATRWYNLKRLPQNDLFCGTWGDSDVGYNFMLVISRWWPI